MTHIEGYADFIVEITREKLGYNADDSSHDDEVLLKLQSGEKLSKSKHVEPQSKMKLYEIFIDNNLEYGDKDWQTKLIVANSQQEADIRAESLAKETYGDSGYRKPIWWAEERTEVDGFKVTVSR